MVDKDVKISDYTDLFTKVLTEEYLSQVHNNYLFL